MRDLKVLIAKKHQLNNLTEEFFFPLAKDASRVVDHIGTNFHHKNDAP